MGRYYSLEYFFSKDDLPKVVEGIDKCLEKLGGHKEALDTFFEKNNGYKDEMLAKKLEVETGEVKELLMWYARLELGEKIKKSIEDNGECSFEAEL